MKKIKHIGRFLIVGFNERERHDWDCLGKYGVIKSEDYTGDFGIDRSVLEYDSADTLDEAIEQAQGLVKDNERSLRIHHIKR